MRLKTTGRSSCAWRRCWPAAAASRGAGFPRPYQRHGHRQHRRGPARRHRDGNAARRSSSRRCRSPAATALSASWRCRRASTTSTFELAGFQSVKREGIRVVINQTLTVDQQLQVATLQETVTVTGESPVVDTIDDRRSAPTSPRSCSPKSRTRATSGRRWRRRPASQMTGVRRRRLAHRHPDRLSSPTASTMQNQTKHRRHRHHRRHQRQRRLLRLRQLRRVPGRRRRQRRDELRRRRGAEHQRQVGRRSLHRQLVQRLGRRRDDHRQRARLPSGPPTQRDDDGFFVRTPLQRGNPIEQQYDINFNIGGPLWKQQGVVLLQLPARTTSTSSSLGFRRARAVEADQRLHVQGHVPAQRNNQIIGFLNKRKKLQDKRDIGPTTPLSAAHYQASRNYPMKVEWTSVLGSRAFLDVLVGNW